MRVISDDMSTKRIWGFRRRLYEMHKCRSWSEIEEGMLLKVQPFLELRTVVELAHRPDADRTAGRSRLY